MQVSSHESRHSPAPAALWAPAICTGAVRASRGSFPTYAASRCCWPTAPCAASVTTVTQGVSCSVSTCCRRCCWALRTAYSSQVSAPAKCRSWLSSWSWTSCKGVDKQEGAAELAGQQNLLVHMCTIERQHKHRTVHRRSSTGRCIRVSQCGDMLLLLSALALVQS
jgi:hypothetical protein